MKSTPKAAPKWGPAQMKSKSERVVHTPSPNKPHAFELIHADEVKPQEVRFLWYPYIPAGRVTSIEGDPGVGKSWLACAIAAAVSTGSPLPGQKPEKRAEANVLMFSGEDGLADTIVPRLISMNANLRNIAFPKARVTLDANGLANLEETMRAFAATIVFIDPVQLYIGGKVDMNKANEVREFMDGLYVAAEHTDSAVVIVRHLRKQTGGNNLYRGLGSIDFAAAVRSVLQVAIDEAGIRHVRHVKANNEAEGMDLSYTIVDRKFIWGNQTPRSLVVTTSKKAAQAKAFLKTVLAEGPVATQEVTQRAADEGIAYATLVRAKEGLVESERVPEGWMWRLIQTPAPLESHVQ